MRQGMECLSVYNIFKLLLTNNVMLVSELKISTDFHDTLFIILGALLTNLCIS